MIMVYMHTNLGTEPRSWNTTLIPEAAKKELLKIGLKPYLLFMHYLEEVHKEERNLNLDYAAECLLFSLDQVTKAQAILIKNGWLNISEGKCTKKNAPSIIIFALGYNSVQTLLIKGKSIRKEFEFVGKLFLDEDDNEEETDETEN